MIKLKPGDKVWVKMNHDPPEWEGRAVEIIKVGTVYAYFGSCCRANMTNGDIQIYTKST